MTGHTPWSEIKHKSPLSKPERECLHGVLAAVSTLDREGIRRVLWFANDLANGTDEEHV